MKKIYLHEVLIGSVIETILFYIVLVIFNFDNLINNPYSLNTFIVFVLLGVVSYIIYEVLKRHILRLFK